MEVLDAGMETVESDDCKGMFRKNRDINSMLTTMQEEVRFSCKDGQKFIDLFCCSNHLPEQHL